MRTYERNYNSKENQKLYNHSKFQLALHKAYSHPNYRFSSITFGSGTINGLCLLAHQQSNRLAAEVDGDNKNRLQLRIVTTTLTDDDTLAADMSLYLENDEYEMALEDLLSLFERNRTQFLFGTSESKNIQNKYNMTIIAEYEVIDTH